MAMDGNSKLPWEGEAYSIKRHGVTITNCDTEPVQTPGCVQAHGALLVLDPTELTIVQASENLEAALGKKASEALGKQVDAVVGNERAQNIRDFLANEPTECNPLYVFTLAPESGAPSLDVSLHSIDDVIVVEFEATGRTIQADPDYYKLVKKTVTRLQCTSTLREFCDVTAEEFQSLTGLDWTG